MFLTEKPRDPSTSPSPSASDPSSPSPLPAPPPLLARPRRRSPRLHPRRRRPAPLPILRPAALAAHLHSGLSLLDAANSASAALDLLLRRRLLLRLLLLSSPSPAPDSLRRAIAEWNRPSLSPPICIAHTPEPPRAAASAARRAIYASEAVAALVLGALAAALGGGGARSAPPLPRVPAEFPWAAEFNKLAEEIPLKLGAGFAGEVEAVADAVTRLTAVIDGDDDPEKLRRAVEEVDKLTEEMTEG
uniref:Uncharacterized protein n=1 Tax=Ananas comosus var. bracteatus TaxID=296719 RepID=A0A6V7PIN0_ANACO|nr:unnamed protein product [Ananas comosus var. bracteatus]